LAFVEKAGDAADGVVLDRVKFVDPTNNPRLLFDDLIIGRTMLTLAHIAIAERRARKHVRLTLASAMPLPATRAFENLRAFVFRDHALELKKQFVLRSCSASCADE